MLFSLRNKLFDDNTIIIHFRNRVWNAFSDLLGIYYQASDISPAVEVNYYQVVSPMLFHVADKLGYDVADTRELRIYDILHEHLEDADQTNSILDFIEAHLETLFEHFSLPFGVTSVNMKPVQDAALEKYARLLIDENQPYQIYENHLVPVVSDPEMQEIEKAATTKYDSVNAHIKKAWLLFSNRKSPDYENSIKESISAVESMCCIITGLSGAQATLGTAIKSLKDSGIHIHGAMEKAFLALYGYASNESGIRHGSIDFQNAPAEDAKFMLISCSAFINYLIEKQKYANELES